MLLLIPIIINPKFHQTLYAIDQDLALITHNSNCPYCNNVLHQANYPRSPNGMPNDQREYYELRFSFCCSHCRTRITPETVRFFGRRWHPAPAHILISALKVGINNKRLIQVQRHLGITVSLSTWKRWRLWWQNQFDETLYWKAARGSLLAQPEDNSQIPRLLIECFSGSLSDRLVRLLKFLSPITGRVLRGI